jgi:hypothetical protein
LVARESTSARPASARSGEEARALTDDHGEGEERHLVDKLVVEQPAEQRAAAMHLQLTSGLCLQVVNGGRDVCRR